MIVYAMTSRSIIKWSHYLVNWIIIMLKHCIDPFQSLLLSLLDISTNPYYFGS